MTSQRGGLLACALLAAVVTASPLARSFQPPPAQEAAPAPVEEVVVGAHAGPSMWKVTSSGNGHVLWILGTLTPLPKRMTWDPSSVTSVLKESQEVVPGLPSFGIGWNPITMVRVYVEWLRLQKSPEKEKLQQVLPPPLYARFEALKARYAADDRHLEELRPMIAAERLLEKTLDAQGLTFHNEVQQTVLKLAHQQGVKVHQDKLKVNDPVDLLRDVRAASRTEEVSCLEAVVTRLETDLPNMRTRASAWSLGDVDTLRKLPYTDDRTACIAAVSTSDRVKNLIDRTLDDWMEAVQDSLASNRSTLAVQTMDRLLGDNGVLEQLRQKGYTIEGP
jgi:uncharacterized protein YbaP (TraB family)